MNRFIKKTIRQITFGTLFLLLLASCNMGVTPEEENKEPEKTKISLQIGLKEPSSSNMNCVPASRSLDDIERIMVRVGDNNNQYSILKDFKTDKNGSAVSKFLKEKYDVENKSVKINATMSDKTVFIGEINKVTTSRNSFVLESKSENGIVKIEESLSSLEGIKVKYYKANSDVNNSKAVNELNENITLEGGNYIFIITDNENKSTAVSVYVCNGFVTTVTKTAYLANRENNISPCTVTYNYNYPDAQDVTESQLVGGVITKPANPVRKGFTFGGWYTSQYADDADISSVLPYDFSTVLTGNITLYAYWQTKNTGLDALTEEGFGTGGELSSEWICDFIEMRYPNDKISNYIPKLVSGAGISGSADDYALVFDATYLGSRSIKFYRDYYIDSKASVSFKIKCELNANYDGVLYFYLDGKQIKTFEQKTGVWQEFSFLVDEGEHTFEWRLCGEYDDYCSDGSASAFIDSLTFQKAPEVASTFAIDFESELNCYYTFGKGASISGDEIFMQWEQYGKALVDTHKKVLKLYTTEGKASEFNILEVVPEVPSVLTFDFKKEYHRNLNLEILVDNDVVKTINLNGDTSNCKWMSDSVEIPAGQHSITIKNKAYNQVVYIDNLNLIPDVMEKVDIYPKTLQETYVDGFDLQFKAKAVRADGSAMEGKNVSWSCTGGTIDSNGLYTPGRVPGTYTVTATIDGMTACNSTVKIHGEDYKSESHTINGVEYKGIISEDPSSISISAEGYNRFTTGKNVPTKKKFTADGFFVVKGHTEKGFYVELNKVIDEYGNVERDKWMQYYFTGDYDERIWLRYGPGEYVVHCYFDVALVFSDVGGDYKGAYRDWGEDYCYNYVNLNVTNVAPTSEEEACTTFPSLICANDSFKITNIANALIGEMGDEPTVEQKLKAGYDWVTQNIYYDDDSLPPESLPPNMDDGSLTEEEKEKIIYELTKRKSQLSLDVIDYGMAVCEGYANTLVALYRAMGLQSKYIWIPKPLNHGWGGVLYNGEWLLVDATWDGGNDEPNRESYGWFLVDLHVLDHSNPIYADDDKTEIGREFGREDLSRSATDETNIITLHNTKQR